MLHVAINLHREREAQTFKKPVPLGPSVLLCALGHQCHPRAIREKLATALFHFFIFRETYLTLGQQLIRHFFSLPLACWDSSLQGRLSVALTVFPNVCSNVAVQV